jgi:hypothetical protein
LIERTENPRVAAIVSRSAGNVSFPEDALIVSSHRAATLISASFTGSAIALRAALPNAGESSPHHRKAWLSIRSRT